MTAYSNHNVKIHPWISSSAKQAFQPELTIQPVGWLPLLAHIIVNPQIFSSLKISLKNLSL